MADDCGKDFVTARQPDRQTDTYVERMEIIKRTNGVKQNYQPTKWNIQTNEWMIKRESEMDQTIEWMNEWINEWVNELQPSEKVKWTKRLNEWMNEQQPSEQEKWTNEWIAKQESEKWLTNEWMK